MGAPATVRVATGRDYDRREALVALGVLVGTTSLAIVDVRNLALMVPALLIPLLAFAMLGHLVGRKAGLACIVMGLSGAFLAYGGPARAGDGDWVLPGLIGVFAWFGAARVESQLASAHQPIPAVGARWMRVEVEMVRPDDVPATIPVNTSVASPRDLHLQIVRRRREVALTRRA